MLRKLRIVPPLVALSLVGVLSACSSPDISKYSAVRAALDPDSITITYPLDAYAIIGRDAYVIEHANDQLVADCMAKSGLPFPRADQNWDTKALPQNRRYGIWVLANAEKFGYNYPEPAATVAIDKEEAKFPNSWWDTWRGCNKKVKQLPVVTELASPSKPSVVDEGIVEALREAQESKEWSTVWQSWNSCIEKHGLQGQSDHTVLMPVLPTNQEEQVRDAVIDVGCKDKIGAIQRLADVESQYESAYMNSHQAALNAYRQHAQSVLKRAQDILSTHGG